MFIFSLLLFLFIINSNILTAVIILVDSFEPSYVIVRMGYKMHVDFRGIHVVARLNKFRPFDFKNKPFKVSYLTVLRSETFAIGFNGGRVGVIENNH